MEKIHFLFDEDTAGNLQVMRSEINRMKNLREQFDPESSLQIYEDLDCTTYTKNFKAALDFLNALAPKKFGGGFANEETAIQQIRRNIGDVEAGGMSCSVEFRNPVLKHLSDVATNGSDHEAQIVLGILQAAKAADIKVTDLYSRTLSGAPIRSPASPAR